MLKSPPQLLYVFGYHFTKFLLKYFLWLLSHFKHLIINNLSLAFMNSIQDWLGLHLRLESPSARLSTRLDSELAINLTWSINAVYVIFSYRFQILSQLALKKLWTFQRFLVSIQTILEIFLLTFFRIKW